MSARKPPPPRYALDETTIPSDAALIARLEIRPCKCPLRKRHVCIDRRHPLGCYPRQISLLGSLGWRPLTGWEQIDEARWRVLPAHRTQAKAEGYLEKDGTVLERQALRLLRIYWQEWEVDPQKNGRCDCPYYPGEPCRHILVADHGLPLERWAVFLWQARHEDYADPPPPDEPALMQSRQARVAIYEDREAQSVHLRHRGDLRPKDTENTDVGVLGENGKNGRALAIELIINGRRTA